MLPALYASPKRTRGSLSRPSSVARSAMRTCATGAVACPAMSSPVHASTNSMGGLPRVVMSRRTRRTSSEPPWRPCGIGAAPAQMLERRAPRLVSSKLSFRPAKLRIEQRALNLEPRYGLQVTCQPEPAHEVDEPLGGIPLPPAHAVAVVVRKHMVKIVVALAVGQQRHHAIVTGRVVIGVGLYAPHVCQGIDKKCEVMADNEAQHARE